MDLLEEVQRISNMANIYYVRQKEALGLGHAVACASHFIGNEPFAVLLGDDIVHSEKPCLKQLIEVFERYNSSVVGVQEVPDEDVSKYGIVAPKTEIEKGVLHVDDLVEKPKLEDAPSNYAIMGRYVLRPEIFKILETLPPGAGNEIQLTDAIKKLNEEQVVLANVFSGKRYDVGDKLGFVKATIDFALMRDDLKSDVLQYLETISEQYLIKE